MPIAIKNHSYPPTLKIVLQYTASLFKKKERKKERGKRKRKKKEPLNVIARVYLGIATF